MKYSAKQYATALFQAVSESRPADQDKILENFVGVLREHQATGFLPQIEEEFFRLDREARGVKLASVTTARELSKTAEAEVVDKLNAYVGGQVELRKRIDESVGGGIMIRLDDELIDASIRRSLADLKNEMIK